MLTNNECDKGWVIIVIEVIGAVAFYHEEVILIRGSYQMQLPPHDSMFISQLQAIHSWFSPTFFFLARLHSLWDLSSPTRDQTRALGSESAKS